MIIYISLQQFAERHLLSEPVLNITMSDLCDMRRKVACEIMLYEGKLSVGVIL